MNAPVKRQLIADFYLGLTLKKFMKVLDKARRKKLQRKVDAEYGYRSYRDRDVEVRKANCGFGVFARRQFLPGELIIEISGQLIPRES